MTKTPLPIIDKLASLRAKSWSLSREEDELLMRIQGVMRYRSAVDEEIDRLEKALTLWHKTSNTEPKGAWGWMK